MGLQWAFIKFPTLPIQFLLFIFYPWCNLSFCLGNHTQIVVVIINNIGQLKII
ncbi:hypothetical protein AHAS_Ahas09G0099600 [Arachis hypogaea]